MRLRPAPKHSLQDVASTCHIVDSQSIALSTNDRPHQTASRHDVQMIAARNVSADPYTAWLEQREADREREAHRLNPRAAWDDLRSQSFLCGRV